MSVKQTTIAIDEIEKFNRIANEWWDIEGKFKPLHYLGPVRLKFIRDSIAAHFPGQDFKDLSLIDIGCGGGLVSEPLAKMGFGVTAIDASEVNINIAKNHANNNNIKINYLACSAENIDEKFDVVIALEIIEHVSDVDFFLQNIANLTKPGGLAIISTINKNIKSYLQAIVAAEYLLRLLPRGTHSYDKFFKPSEIARKAAEFRLYPIDIKGMSYNILKKKWQLCTEPDVNYIMALSLQA